MNEELETLIQDLTRSNAALTARNLELSRVNDELLSVLAGIDVAVLSLDSEQRLCRYSPKAQTTFDLGASDVGGPIAALERTIGFPDLARHVRAVFETLVPEEHEFQDSKQRWWRLHILPRRTADGRAEGIVLSLVDIHELKHSAQAAVSAMERAENANQARDRFLAVVSHSLRTPLASVLMHAQILRAERLDPPRVDAALAAIERAAKMQVQVVDDLLDLSQIVAGSFELNPRRCDLAAEVQAALNELKPSIERKALTLHTALDSSLGPIWADPKRIRQVVNNLVTNAIKFTPQRGSIQVTLEAAEGEACLSVRDSGIGIAPELLPELFDRLSPRAEATSYRRAGLGLGLAIVEHIVKASGGRVAADSAGPGRGAVFRVSFPLQLAAGPELAPRSSRLPPERLLDRPGRAFAYSELQGLRVLVLEDDPATLDAVLVVFRLSGLEARGVPSAAEALVELDRFHPQALVCDLALPDEDGFAFIRKVRARGRERGGQIPALALSGLRSEEVRQRAFRAGFQLHMAKPVDIDQLRDAVVQLLRNLPADRRA